MSEKIRTALSQLNVNDPTHWTSDGLPVIDVVKTILGANVTRAEITAAAKGFSKKSPSLEAAPQAPAAAPVAQTDFAGISAAPPAVTSPVAQDSEPKEPEVPEMDVAEVAAAKAEIDAARLVLQAAQTRMAAANVVMDGHITRNALALKAVTFAESVKGYQAAQIAMREDSVARRKVAAAAMAASKVKY